jgi:hypothetical protein
VAIFVTHGMTIPVLSWDRLFAQAGHHGYCNMNTSPMLDEGDYYSPAFTIEPQICSSNHLLVLSTPPCAEQLAAWLQSGVAVHASAIPGYRKKHVYRWADQTSNANDAVQLSVANQPWLHASNSLHRQYVLRFPSRKQEEAVAEAETASFTGSSDVAVDASKAYVESEGRFITMELNHDRRNNVAADAGITFALLLKPFKLLDASQSIRITLANDAHNSLLFTANADGSVRFALTTTTTTTTSTATSDSAVANADDNAMLLPAGALHVNEWAVVVVAIDSAGIASLCISKPGAARLRVDQHALNSTAACSWAKVVFGCEHAERSIIGQLAEVLVYDARLRDEHMENLLKCLEYRIGF